MAVESTPKSSLKHDPVAKQEETPIVKKKSPSPNGKLASPGGGSEEQRKVLEDSQTYSSPAALSLGSPASNETSSSANATAAEGVMCASPEIAAEIAKLYVHIEKNEFKGGATGKLPRHDIIPCDCSYEQGVDMRNQACGEESNCINRELFIECNAEDCHSGQYCQNRRFQLRQYAPIEVFKTEKKGFGLRARSPINAHAFVIEYCGEVISTSIFKKRTQEYSEMGVKHFYFMSLQSNEFIDASKKGNISRFMNHSCSPNCALTKWMVGSQCRIGIFALRNIAQGEELTFDYKFERYGANAQPCYCGEANCSGFIGGKTSKSLGDTNAYAGEIEGDEANDKGARVRRRKQRSDADTDDEYDEEEAKNVTGLSTVDETRDLIKDLMRTNCDKRLISPLLLKLEKTESTSLLRKFLHLRGHIVLNNRLYDFESDQRLTLWLLRVMKMLPFVSSYQVASIEGRIKLLAELPDFEISQIAKEMLELWAALPTPYKIPKRPKPQSGDSTCRSSQSPPKRARSREGSEGQGSWDQSKRQRTHHAFESHPQGDHYRGERRLSSSHDAYGPTSEGWHSQRRYYQQPHHLQRDVVPERGGTIHYPHQVGQRANGWAPNPPSPQAPRSPSYSIFESPTTHRDVYAAPRERRSSERAKRKPTTPPAASPETPALPPDWKVAHSAEGRPYYYNVKTNEVTWEPPTFRPPPEEHMRLVLPSLVEGVPPAAVKAGAEVPAQRADNHKGKEKAKEKPKDKALNGEFLLEHHKRLKAEISGIVVKQMSLFKASIGVERFKEMAKALTKALLDKEQRSRHHQREFSGLSAISKASAKKYVKEYLHRKGYVESQRLRAGSQSVDHADAMDLSPS
ncbi:histone methyltransferase set2 [Borealophlyctis nickersoniae]|nr:histone methyltransferase set2 [Borealophlyctis nickersoniae]